MQTNLQPGFLMDLKGGMAMPHYVTLGDISGAPLGQCMQNKHLLSRDWVHVGQL